METERDTARIEIGRRLREAREREGLLQRNVAEEFEISLQMVGMVERADASLPPVLAGKYSRRFKLNVRDLLTDSEWEDAYHRVVAELASMDPEQRAAFLAMSGATTRRQL